MWEYNNTPTFLKCSEDLGLSDFVLESLERWAKTVYRTQTNRTKCCFRSPSNKFEIWTSRVPDPDSNTGSSGGFRLVYFFLLESAGIHLDLIERRKNLGFKQEHTKDQQKFTKYINDLKKYLMAEIEN